MELVNIAGTLKDLDEVLLRCCRSECFQIEPAGKCIDASSGFTVLNDENPYTDALKDIYSLMLSLSIKPHKTDFSEIESDNADELAGDVKSIVGKFSVLEKEIKEMENDISLREQASAQLKHLNGIDADYQRLFSMKHIHIRFGKLPVDSFKKLEYYEDRPFIFFHYDNDSEYYWGMYVVPGEYTQVIDNIFESLYFERILLPDFVEGSGTEAIANNDKMLADLKTELEEKKNLLGKMVSENDDHINMIYCRLKFLHDIFSLRRNAAVLKGKFYIAGFVPESDAKRFSSLFAEMSDVSVILNPAELDGRMVIPSKLKNGRFSKPFAMFVEMYGLPPYHGFNPTMLVAITYTLLFGIMFGDLGQGILLSIIGAIIYKKSKNALGAILTRVGISSAFFGLIFGSVFGYENLLDPLYKSIGLQHKPIEVMENTTTILYAAIALGVALILISIIMNIIIGIRNKNFESAFFSNNGLAGIVFYGGLLTALVAMIMGINLFTPLYVVVILVLPLLLMFFREPLSCLVARKKFEIHGIGDFIASNFFEVFEFVLGYATNTLSFVRVGGFVLSHAGMMSVVMLLAETASKGASPVIIIIGNLFVMGMEGLIVGIQVLRLEFYEIFSRFYESGGRPFEPVRVDYESVIE